MALEKIVIDEPARVAQATDLSTPGEVKEIERQASAAKILAEQDVSKTETARDPTEAKVYGEIGMEMLGGGILKMASSALEIMEDKSEGAKAPAAPQKDKQDLMERFNLWNGSLHMKSPKFLDGSGEFSDTKNMQVENAKLDMKMEGVGIARMLAVHNVMANKAAMDSVKVYEQKYDAAAGNVMRAAPTLGMGMMGPSPNLATLQSGAETAPEEEMWQRNKRLMEQGS